MVVLCEHVQSRVLCGRVVACERVVGVVLRVLCVLWVTRLSHLLH